jgi:hypothetical protein
MRAAFSTIVILLAVAAAGCRRGVETGPRDLASFTNNLGRYYDMVALGMVRSNVHESFGKPGQVRTNTGPYSNWVTDRYLYDPEPFVRHYPDIWSGFALSYSNGVLVRKEHIIRKGQP